MSHHRTKSGLVASTLIIALCAACTPPADRKEGTSQTSSDLNGSSRVTPEFLAEVRALAKSRTKLSQGQIDALTSNLSSMNFDQVGALVTGNTSALQGLVVRTGASAGGAAAGATQGAVTRVGVAPGAGGSATERMLGDARDLRGGFTDGGTGQVSEEAEVATCLACSSNDGVVGSQSNTDPASDEDVKVVPLSAGGKAYVYSDGSFTIKDASGKQEVYNSINLPRTDSVRWTANKTPVPDGEGGRRSGLISADEWRTLLGTIGSRGAPEADPATGAGGVVPDTRTTAGTPIEPDTAYVVDTVQLREVLRIAVEKLGPRLR